MTGSAIFNPDECSASARALRIIIAAGGMPNDQATTVSDRLSILPHLVLRAEDLAAQDEFLDI